MQLPNGLERTYCKGNRLGDGEYDSRNRSCKNDGTSGPKAIHLEEHPSEIGA